MVGGAWHKTQVIGSPENQASMDGEKEEIRAGMSV